MLLFLKFHMPTPAIAGGQCQERIHRCGPCFVLDGMIDEQKGDAYVMESGEAVYTDQ